MPEGRTIDDAFLHLRKEIAELALEVRNVRFELEPGVDGILGEGIDAIQCILDMILMVHPNITEADLRRVMFDKCEKWVKLYGEKSNG